MNQKNHENEKQYEIYWNEKRTLALQIANWAKNSTDYPTEAVTRFLRQYGGGDTGSRENKKSPMNRLAWRWEILNTGIPHFRTVWRQRYRLISTKQDK